jgi:hypothetical protein
MWVNVVVAVIVMPFDVHQVGGCCNAGLLIEIAHITAEVGIIHNAL